MIAHWPWLLILPLTVEEKARIARLEHDPAQLRAGGDPAPGDTPTSTR